MSTILTAIVIVSVSGSAFYLYTRWLFAHGVTHCHNCGLWFAKRHEKHLKTIMQHAVVCPQCYTLFMKTKHTAQDRGHRLPIDRLFLLLGMAVVGFCAFMVVKIVVNL